MGILEFFRDKKKQENKQPIIIGGEGDYSETVMSGSVAKEYGAHLKELFETAIENYVAESCLETTDQKAILNLNSVTDNLDMVMSIIVEKMPLCLKDGKGHSKAFLANSGGPYINVSCWPCDINELKDYFKNQIGDYSVLLPRYVGKAQESGANSFIHLFICYVDKKDKVSVTLCYADTKLKTKIIPVELIGKS